MFLTVLSNETKSNNSSNSKFDCAKECPCGVPVIPVPDQWLEVMVTGGFKVWHIIFIIIAFIVTMTVVYCCFHRCRIPRTKQEIEADLMRTNLASKFTYHLQELPNEPTTFIEALKKVQEYAEKLEREDADYNKEMGARKRMVWLKFKGKGDKQQQQQEDKDKDPEEGEPKDQSQPAEGDNSNIVSNETQVKGAIDAPKEPTEPKAEANGDIQVPDTIVDNVDNNSKKVKNEDDRSNKPAKHTHKRRHKPGLSRTKATGRHENSPPLLGGGEDFHPTLVPPVIDYEKQPQSLGIPRRDQKKRQLQEPTGEPPSSPSAPKVLKHKSTIGDIPQQAHHHHVKIDMKTRTLGVNGNSAGKL